MFQLGSKKEAFKASIASVTLTATDAPLGACRTGVTRPINGPIVSANRGWVTGDSEVIGSSFELVPANALLESFRFGDPRPNEAIILGNRCRAEVLPSPSRYRLMQ